MQISLIAIVRMPRTSGGKQLAEVIVSDHTNFEDAQVAHEATLVDNPEIVKVILEALQAHLASMLTVEYVLKNSSVRMI